EDGIRDLIVTGVQTCALPILSYFQFQRRRSHLDCAAAESLGRLLPGRVEGHAQADHQHGSALGFLSGSARREQKMAFLALGCPRSEERRVGKVFGATWLPGSL